MSRIEILQRAFKEWQDEFNALPSDDKPVAIIVAVFATLVFLLAAIGLVALVLSMLASYWWVLVAIVAVWYFWPRISDLIKKRG